MINRVVLIGRLTKDVQLRYTQNGVAVASFTIAVNRVHTNQQGEREADFINIIAWRKTAENTANFVKKGSLIGIDGRIQTRSYDGQDGKKVYVTEVLAESVQFLDPKGAGNGNNNNNNNNNGNNNTNNNNYNNNNGGNYSTNNNPNHNTSNNSNNRNYNTNDDPFAKEDPFANSGGPIEVSEDDLPF
ncbi:single-stranded DNA-binding protein [Viridibacillus arvi]|uniref:single-stranded DNA-binding protein n=1 Tax=Viridibacillus arvi TaxID=263475 RepID=UPI0034CE3E53